MKKSILLLSALMIFSCSGAQQAEKGLKSSPEKYLKTITATDLKTHLYIVADDTMEGRQTGEPGQKRAGQYLIDQYKAMGVSYPPAASSFYQSVPASFMNSRRGKLKDSENIWAFIEGSEHPEEIIVISAHYDHIGTENGEVFNGADDDGSGTVALLEMAEAFAKAKKDGNGPKRSILFLHVTGEEHGLHGSRYYSENPLYPLANTVADINIDMIGRRDDLHPKTNNYVYVIGSDRLSSELHTITNEVNDKYIKMDLDFRFNARDEPNRYYFRSDHYNFAKNGIPSVFLFNGVHDDYHKATDTPDKIEYDALEKRTQLAFAIAWELANRKDRIKVDRDGQ
ncbi:M28 family metallopeptidase [Flavobacterium ardleyense]|uniref:M28 family metallopeptidase n=1 Tax=Flavobacterium ardleyense TaxID=2038737 RepID=UPI00298D32B0|nr:M28 family metallopeptidase [Flavobacterium ardleyense]